MNRNSKLAIKSEKRLEIFKAAWNLLDKREKRRIVIVTGIQFSLSLLDLVGVTAIAALGALSVRGVQSQKPGDTVARLLKFLHLSKLDFRSQAMIIAILAAVLMVIKTISSVYLTRRINYFLSQRSARLSGDLIEKAFSNSFLFLKSHSQQQLLFSLTAGVNAITIGVIAPIVALIADGSLLLLMSAALFVVQPVLSISSFMIFGSIAMMLHKSLVKRAARLGNLDTKLNIESTSKIVELLSTFREIKVQGSLARQIESIQEIRRSLASTSAEMSFMPNITKYVMEVTLIVSGLFLGTYAFAVDDAVHAIAILVLFLAAGFRIAPAILRIQQGLILANSSVSAAAPTLEMAADLSKVQTATPEKNIFIRKDEIQPIKISISDLYYRYPGQRENFISNLNLEVEPGEAVAIVGPSGAGKTTLVDLILGILQPTLGNVFLDNVSPAELCGSKLGVVAYVPQNSFLINASLYKNVTLGLVESSVSTEQVLEALKYANLLEFAMGLPNKLEELIGDSGIQLSGGQKQRLGLARAFVTNPKLLILDEATSALDAETESQINSSLYRLKGSATLVIIAHRLATVRSLERVIYIDRGRILADGSFEHVRRTIPDFDRQAKLMGL